MLQREMFGANLEEYAAVHGGVPGPILEAISHIRKNGLKTEGIFRVSPTRTGLDDTINLIEEGTTVRWESLPVHVACGAVKEFMREMSEPLMTSGMYDQWLSLEEGGADTGPRIEELTRQLPPTHRRLFLEIMQLCAEAMEHTEESMMGSKQLAIVLAPNMIHQDMSSTDPIAVVAAMASCNQVVFHCINHFSSNQDVLRALLSTCSSQEKCQKAPPILEAPSSPAPSSPSPSRLQTHMKGTRAQSDTSSVEVSARPAVSELRPPNRKGARSNLDPPKLRSSASQVVITATGVASTVPKLRNAPTEPRLDITVEESVEIAVEQDLDDLIAPSHLPFPQDIALLPLLTETHPESQIESPTSEAPPAAKSPSPSQAPSPPPPTTLAPEPNQSDEAAAAWKRGVLRRPEG